MEWYLIALISAFFSAVAAILEKKILFKRKALSMCFVLAIFNLILCLPFFFFVNYSLVSGVALGVLFFKSVLAALAFLLVMRGVRELDISRALPLLVLTPALVAVFAFLFLGEALTLMEISGMVLILVGTYILQISGDKSFWAPVKVFLNSRGNYYLLAALALYTTTAVLDKLLLGGYKIPLNAFMGFGHLFVAIIVLVFSMIYFDKKEIKNSFKFSWMLIGVLALVTVIYRYSQYYAVSVAPVALVIAIKRMAVFFAVLFGGMLFRDENLWIRVFATVLMVAGAVLIILA